MMHHHWRGCKEWKDAGLPLTTTSDEAVRLFDAALTQYTAFRELEECGGLSKTFENMKKADPEFVLGRVLQNAMELIWSNISSIKNEHFTLDLNLTFDFAKKSKNLTQREKLHVEALKFLSYGQSKKASDVFESILRDNPTDLMALKLFQDISIVYADKQGMRVVIERIFKQWKSDIPLYNYLFGMMAFSLCENGDYATSEVYAKKGLEMNPTDIWSTHALAHDYEMTGQYIEGERFLDSTVRYWEPHNTLSRHVNWHNALFSIERGDFEKALGIFDDKVITHIDQSFSAYDLVDVTALLYRLQLQGLNVKDRYDLIFDLCLKHMDDHLTTFSDLHNLMAILGSCHRSEGEKFVNGLKDLLAKHPDLPTDYLQISAKVSIPLSEGMLAFDCGHFDEAVNWMKPVVDDIVKIGGSDAQRDVFSQLILNAAINSTHPDHQQYAEDLLKMRKQAKQDSPLTDRLLSKFMHLQQSRS